MPNKMLTDGGIANSYKKSVENDEEGIDVFSDEAGLSPGEKPKVVIPFSEIETEDVDKTCMAGVEAQYAKNDGKPVWDQLACGKWWKDNWLGIGFAVLGVKGGIDSIKEFKQIAGNSKNMRMQFELEVEFNKAGINKPLHEITDADIASIDDPIKQGKLIDSLKEKGVINKDMKVVALDTKMLDDELVKFGIDPEVKLSKVDPKYISADGSKLVIPYKVKKIEATKIGGEVKPKFKADAGKLTSIEMDNRVFAMDGILDSKFKGEIASVDDLKFFDDLLESNDFKKLSDADKVKKLKNAGISNIKTSSLDDFAGKIKVSNVEMDKLGIEPRIDSGKMDELKKMWDSNYAGDFGDFKGPKSFQTIDVDKWNMEDFKKLQDPSAGFELISGNEKLLELDDPEIPGKKVKKIVNEVAIDPEVSNYGKSLDPNVDLDSSIKKLETLDAEFKNSPPTFKVNKKGEIPEVDMKNMMNKFDNDPKKLMSSLDELSDNEFKFLKNKGVVPDQYSRIKVDGGKVEIVRVSSPDIDFPGGKSKGFSKVAAEGVPALGEDITRISKSMNKTSKEVLMAGAGKAFSGAAMGAGISAIMGLATGEDFKDETFNETIMGAAVGGALGELMEYSLKRMAKSIANRSAKKAGQKVAKQIAEKALKEGVEELAAKAAGKLAAEAAQKLAAQAAAKGLAKLALPVIGWALAVFDIINIIVDLIDPCGFNKVKDKEMYDIEVDGYEMSFKALMDSFGKQYPAEAKPELLRSYIVTDPLTGKTKSVVSNEDALEFNKYYNDYFKLCNLNHNATCRDNVFDSMAMNSFRQGRIQMANNLNTNMRNPYSLQPVINNEISIGDTSVLSKLAIESDLDVLEAELDTKSDLIKGKIKVETINNATKITNKSISKILAEETSFKKTIYYAITILCIFLIIGLSFPFGNDESS
jgi:hypothetical protein